VYHEITEQLRMYLNGGEEIQLHERHQDNMMRGKAGPALKYHAGMVNGCEGS